MKENLCVKILHIKSIKTVKNPLFCELIKGARVNHCSFNKKLKMSAPYHPSRLSHPDKGS